MMNKARVIGTTVAAINAAETELARTLPKSFSEWLLNNNGKALGALVVFPVFDARDPRKTWESIVRHFKGDWQGWRDNFSGSAVDFSQLLPFAEFGTGDYYCFDYKNLGDAGEPVVVLWSHETGETLVVADSFAAFLTMPGRPG
ncbi:SMI1/KNR4 family protein [Burkholderia gladioli]|uniref:SMI1/KNR4 family protein n=1 Tax=Burkholderia gladioli TaxID=28095 RepID=A0AB38TUW7_BURGA|nr:SMI1/KNR4 family protein [Burkholderia gladioli]MBU9189668.1 SMI1/KNR4 family protein [Burkholderia gladioli]MBU9271271.1 SMI1/KNR4 family protein [Burkholderia gladioli]MBU9277984.1 SMI1/KNR4 family protein [Burkholderia gladioli]MBU9323476.1 SMI1/KNR4 family protein [Burkholderia gladioli]MBU9687692.1 SMI1/KNR4 family protein [Burkholderia gladioli]